MWDVRVGRALDLRGRETGSQRRTAIPIRVMRVIKVIRAIRVIRVY